MSSAPARPLLALCLAIAACQQPDEAPAMEDMAQPPAGEPSDYRRLPEKANALTAAVLEDRLYVLGGHVGGAHESSIDNFLSAFRRLPLTAEGAWQDLRAPGPPLQQAALFVYDGRLYRLGGLTAKNRKDQPKDLFTTADAWQDLAPMPDTRASHSVVIVDGVLYVMGGWKLNGGTAGTYYDTWLSFDLKDPQGAWKEHPQKFKVRDHCAAAADGKVYVLGGMLTGMFPGRAQVYDPGADAWSEGPELPAGSPVRGFGCAALSLGGTLYYTASEGVLHRLKAGRDGWEPAGRLKVPRAFHALAARSDRELIAVGGAIDAASTPTDSVESIPLP
jgi:N-acetylneuraminic acid mutarotase